MPSPYEVAREKLEEKTKAIVEGRLGYVAAVKSILSLEIPHEGKTIRFGAYYEDAEVPNKPVRWMGSEGKRNYGEAISDETKKEFIDEGWVKKISKEE